ncbi:UROD/MetE-like protein [Exidia glandulosa HHB12029]|uniref:UROD/MetE-like protein n=1 Tax=Exidia glandulosa HHB12029 TaxID=1314781 RepID=A0A165MDM2_EXIGL|nr:UROD/MetE-like protein [Exidia glandulosa HHB12029]
MSTPRLNPPFRAEHLGSLKRPTELLAKRAAFDKEELSPEELRAEEDKAIADIIALQREVGIKSITDGEFRRHMFYDGFFDNLDGFEYVGDVPQDWFMDYVPDTMPFKVINEYKNAASHLCRGKIKRTKQMYVPQFELLKKFVKPEEVPNLKLTLCAPEWFHLRHGEHAYEKSLYPNDEAYFADIVTAYREEIADLYAAGARNLQFDDPLLAYFCAESMISGMKEVGIDSEALLDLYIDVYNKIIAGRPKDLTIGVHLCRGNFRGGIHFSEGGYDRIAVKLFNVMKMDCYYLEYDTERAGTFEPLKHLPRDRTVVLGLISSKIGKLEDMEDLKARINHAAELIASGEEKRSKEEALNQICISPQCGFASHSDGNNVTDEDMYKKLKLVTETAKQIWG